MMRAAVRQAIFRPPAWMQPERLSTTDAAWPLPRVVDARGNVVSGYNPVSGAEIPGPDVPPMPAGRNIEMGDGQSIATIVGTQPADTTPLDVAYDGKMPDTGLKTGAVGNAYSCTITGATSMVQVAESDNSAFGFTTEGETWHRAFVEEFADLALARTGLALLDNKWFSQICAKNGLSLAARQYGSTISQYRKDQMKIALALCEAGSALRFVSQHGTEADAITSITFDEAYASYLNFALGDQDFARRVHNQKHCVYQVVWQDSYSITVNNGPALASYAFATNHPLGVWMGPIWHLTGRDGGDHLHPELPFQAGIATMMARTMEERLLHPAPHTPTAIEFTDWSWDGTHITLTYDIPASPLHIATAVNELGTMTGPAFQNGIRMYDTIGDMALDDFSIVEVSAHVGGVRFRPDRTSWTGATYINVGLDYAVPGVAITNSAACNIYDDTAYPQNVVPHHQVRLQ